MTINLELYPLEQEPERIGTIHHSAHGVAASLKYEYKSKLAIRRYLCGLEPANYPVPATTGEVFLDPFGHCIGLEWAQDPDMYLAVWFAGASPIYNYNDRD